MSPLRLKIWHVEQTCIFELSWSKGQQLTTRVPFAETLKTRYHHWRQTYLDFYSSQEFHQSKLRARVDMSGSMTTPAVDWRARLVQAEAELTSEFHHWLSSADLLTIRREIASGGQPSTDSGGNLTTAQFVDVFLTCDSLELERLPWETWEIGMEFATQKTIRFVRTPPNIAAETTQHQRQGKMRILAILGDDTGLNFQVEKQALKDFAAIAAVTFKGWQPGTDGMSLLEDIRRAIADSQGWDILFFAGHSNETNFTGGELSIAPNQAILMNEIAPQLLTAKERGLKFAIFNSCQGLSIANALINLGLSQVAIMREPVHNQVAQEFFVHFLRQIANYQDVQEALRSTCQWFKLEKSLTYPSAYLIPSLFRHPNSVPFRLKPSGWREQLKQWLPTRREALALAALLCLGMYSPVQSWLLEQRLVVQSVYRQITGQSGQMSQANVPPILVVQIDDPSIQKAGISSVNPMDRPYVTKLVERLTALDARVVGIDFLLDRPQNGDAQLNQAIQSAIQRQGTWFVFAARVNDADQWFSTVPTIAQPNWSLQGDMWVPFWYIRPLSWFDGIPPPFSYQLAIAHRLAVAPPQSNLLVPPPQPNLQSQEPLITQVNTYLQRAATTDHSPFVTDRMRLQPITAFSYGFQHRWFQPILDFSLPPQQVYASLPAWQLLESGETALKPLGMTSLRDVIVILAPGGYDEAGLAAKGEDNFPLPAAVAYWRRWLNLPNPDRRFTGGEAHAYMTHHFLTHHLVVPIPDIWLILVAVVVGKGLSLGFRQPGRRWVWILIGGTASYGLVSLQLYISAELLLPWLLPSTVVWLYGLPGLMRKNNESS